MAMRFVGIDWADAHHDVVVLDEEGQTIASQRVPHSAVGLSQLTQVLLGLSVDVADLVCLVETSHGLLVSALLEAGLAVYPVNPRTVATLRPPSGVKTDALDALLLARKGRSDWPHLRRLQPDPPLLTELKQLTRDQELLIHEQTRLVNQLSACLKDYYPVALTFFAKLRLGVTLRFLQAFPSLEQVQAASVDELQTVLDAGYYPHAATKAAALQRQVQEPQLHAPPAVVRAKVRLLLALVAQLEVLRQQVVDYDQAIQTLFVQHTDSALFQSLPGAAKRLAPRLLAEWGEDRERYTQASSVQARAGTAPVLYQSGQYRRVRQRAGCCKPFRAALYQFAAQSRLQEGWTRDYYDRKRAEGKTHSMAVRALANHWTRILFAMWQQRQPYDREVFLAARQAHARAVA
jgi:transposase